MEWKGFILGFLVSPFMAMTDIGSLKQTCRYFATELERKKFWVSYLASHYNLIHNDKKLTVKRTYIHLHVLYKTLKPHQKEVVYGRYNHPAIFLAMDPGTGKTITSLAVTILRDGPKLVLCPKTLLFHWRSEIFKFYGSTVTCHILQGKCHLQNIKQLAGQYDFIIASYETLTKDYNKCLENNLIVKKGNTQDVRKFRQVSLKGMQRNERIHDILKVCNNNSLSLFSLTWNTIIFDEAHVVRNNNTIRFIASASLSTLSKILLTATPIINHPKDEESLDRLVLGELEHGRLINKDEIYRKIVPFKQVESLQHIKEKVVTCEVELSSEQKIIYNDYIDEFFKQQHRKDTASALRCITRLRQLCISLYTMDHTNPEYRKSFLTSPKIKKTIELIQEITSKGEKVVIFSNFNVTLVELQRVVGGILLIGTSSLKERENIQSAVSTNDILFTNFKVGGVGLNLTKLNHVIIMEPWWNTPLENQAISRILRYGQSKLVHIYNLIATDSIETYMSFIKNNKTNHYNTIGTQEGELQRLVSTMKSRHYHMKIE